MAKLTTKQRNALPSSEFAIPSERKYPINDASHKKDARPETFCREESYGKDKQVEEAKQLSAAESARSIEKGYYYGRNED
jgi:hypothetical protein